MNSAKNFFLPSFKKTFCLRPLVPLFAVLNQFIATANTHSGISYHPTEDFNMAQQNVQGATTKPTAASAQTNSDLTVPQVYDLFCYVKAVCGRSTGTIEPPVVPAGAEELFADFGDFDTISVWIVGGWPVAASDQMTMTHWRMNSGQ